MAAIYDSFQKLDDPKDNARGRQDFVFHMTDWLEDLKRLSELYRDPTRFDKKTAADIVAGFLIHVPAHIRAASRLLLDLTPDDIFLELEAYWSKNRPSSPLRRSTPACPTPEAAAPR